MIMDYHWIDHGLSPSMVDGLHWGSTSSGAESRVSRYTEVDQRVPVPRAAGPSERVLRPVAEAVGRFDGQKTYMVH